MKITGVKIEKLLLELTSPFRVAFGTITHSENVMIKVTTDEGVTGYGEAAPLAFVTAETTDSVIAALELFRTGLIGMDPLDIEAVHAMMDGLMGGNSSAKCAVDLAMYDIRGKAAGMPVYKLLGGYSNTVLNDITVSIMEPQAMADKALSYVRDKGYRVLKVKVGADKTVLPHPCAAAQRTRYRHTAASVYVQIQIHFPGLFHFPFSFVMMRMTAVPAEPGCVRTGHSSKQTIPGTARRRHTAVSYC